MPVITPPDPALMVLNSLTLDEKIGQLLIIGFTEPNPSVRALSLIQDHKVGGVILFRRNYNDFAGAISLNNQLHLWNQDHPLPLFIGIDEEGGTVSRLPAGGTRFPDAHVLGKIGDVALTEKVAETMAKELKALGVNMNFAPVLDIAISPTSPLARRSFGPEASLVAAQGVSFVAGHKKQGIIAVPKHFPGHGDTATDSHGKLPRILVNRETFFARELAPFRAAILSGIDALMVGHVSYPNIDPSGVPATRSKIILTEILRRELLFNGLIITDEIEMVAFLAQEKLLAPAIVQSLLAGVDIFIVGHTYSVQLEVIAAIKQAVVSGHLTIERIDQSVLRIIKVKQKYKLKEATFLEIEQARSTFGTVENKAVLDEVRKRSK
ncbi:MAG: glycoside hydrolase family 3 N-terminal domain-containing protein [bacterium]|nr:glycoside hydrolase family 3 N-terminal domain-containing protein [bacterium]